MTDFQKALCGYRGDPVLKPIFVVQKLTAIEKMIEVQEKELITATVPKLPTIQYLIAEYQERKKNYYGV